MNGHFVYYRGFLFDVILTAAHAQNMEGRMWNYWMVKNSTYFTVLQPFHCCHSLFINVLFKDGVTI